MVCFRYMKMKQPRPHHDHQKEQRSRFRRTVHALHQKHTLLLRQQHNEFVFYSNDDDPGNVFVGQSRIHT
ncbi:Unknown protein sequence [Pseudomonas caricapapayae]|uniref:Uncharacterized protein n=1 Tax=Pseudomonas caricapapayae TaxID=46678 RepID=A0A0P9JVG6_9PSED|nr:Unknown protein sequence [Pseudomonas caricapapayae]RMM14786.1 hypothetical protein ALQ84_00935 [Pseudomonas caricapapayae]RMV75244.1 hypothetical protein ALP05_00190 [Pseudomonas caricapapayae]RMV94674.1 hypothetical protein ALP01_02965 [Pseudomonas caricapapayae]